MRAHRCTVLKDRFHQFDGHPGGEIFANHKARRLFAGQDFVSFRSLRFFDSVNGTNRIKGSRGHMNLVRFGNFAGNLANAGRRIINGEVQFLPDLQTAGEHRGPIDPLINGAGRDSRLPASSPRVSPHSSRCRRLFQLIRSRDRPRT